MPSHRSSLRRKALGRLVLLTLGLALAGCALTQQARLRRSTDSGLVDVRLLEPGGRGQAALRYVDPDARWTRYHRVLLEPVAFFAGYDTKVSPADQRMLCDYLYQELQKALAAKFEMVTAPGPDVLKLQFALTDVEGATPVLRSVSMLVPQARALVSLQYLATGTYTFVGSAQGEAKITDSVTGRVLGEWIDRRVGGGSIEAAAQWKWGDVENAIDAWSAQAAGRLYAWTQGTATP
jgi:Protein of unknown function (DUF3313)